MNLKKFLGLPVAAGLLVTAMLAGCSGEKKSVSASEAASEMYSHISADATVLVRVDFKSVMENAGADFSGDKFKPGKVLQEVLDKVSDEVPEFNEEMLDKVFAAVDMENVVISTYTGKDYFLTAPLLDKDLLISEFKSEHLEKFDPSEFDDGELDDYGREVLEQLKCYDIYCFTEDGYEMAYMLRDNQIWLTEAPLGVIDDYKRAAENSVASNPKRLALLTAGTVNALLDMESLSNIAGYNTAKGIGMNVDYMALNFVLDGGSLTGETRLYDKEFVQQSYDLSQYGSTISEKDFAQLPSDANVVIALGCPKTENIKAILDYLNLDYFVRALVEDVLNGMEGSIVAGVTIPASMTDMMNPAAWDATLAVGFEEETARNLLSLLTLAGAREYGSGYKIDLPVDHLGRVTLYMAYEEGQLVVSTKPLGSGHGFTGAKSLCGSVFGLYVNLPSDGLPMQMSGMECGVNADMIVDKDGVSGQLHLTDTKNALLTTILERIIR